MTTDNGKIRVSFEDLTLAELDERFAALAQMPRLE